MGNRADAADRPDRLDTGTVSAPVAGAAGALTAREAAARLGVSERTVRRAIARGELAAAKYAGTFRIAPAALARYRDRLAGLSPPDRSVSEPPATLLAARRIGPPGSPWSRRTGRRYRPP